MPRKGRGKRRWAGKGASVGGGPSAPNPTASSGAVTTTTTPAIAAITNNGGGRSSSTAGRAKNNPLLLAVPTRLTVGSGQHRARAATSRAVAPSRVPSRVSFVKAKLNPMQDRTVYSAGADQVLARPPPKLYVTVEISWPSARHGYKDIDPADVDVKAVLSRIASEHGAKIEASEVGSGVMLTVKTTTRPKAKEVIAVLRNQLRYRPGEENVWQANLLVNPPKDMEGHLTVALQPKEGSTGRRAIVTATTRDLASVDSAGLVEAKTKYKKEFTDALDHMAGILRYVPNGMRMRVHFGNLVLNEWKKDKSEYTLAELGSLVHRAGKRGTAQMLSAVSETAAKALKNQLVASNKELPQLVREYLEEGEPTRSYSLILETKNLHVESSFEPVQGQEKRGQQVKQYTLGPFTVYQLEKQHRSAEVVTVCPESAHDWTIEIRKGAVDQGVKASAPFRVEELQSNITFAGGSLAGLYPNISIYKHFLEKHAIQKVRGKATLKYTLNMQFSLEINLFHVWEPSKSGLKMSATPVTTASVVLYGDIWDHEMRSDVSTPREWDSSFVEQFLKQFDDEEVPGKPPRRVANHLDHFFAWIDWIQKGLDGGVDKSGKTGGRKA